MFTLPEFPKKVKYTMTEYHMFAVLPQDGKRIVSADIVEARGDKWKVGFPLKNVTVTMNRLIDKVKANDEPFRIKKEARYPGHLQCEYWIERRGTRKKKANGK